jgi:hypothetical protein
MQCVAEKSALADDKDNEQVVTKIDQKMSTYNYNYLTCVIGEMCELV